jgi:hypothetical protein
MQTYHAETVVEQDGKVVLSGLPFSKGEKVEIVIRPAHPNEEDEAWRRLAIESFFRDSSDKDADYDNY